MLLCLDPGSKYLGYSVIENFTIHAIGVIHIEKDHYFYLLEKILSTHQIKIVLIEQGDCNLRIYEQILYNFFQLKGYKIFFYNSKTVRKKLRLERHPASEGIRAKYLLAKKSFPLTPWDSIPIHILDSALLYIYHQKYTS